eukprot:TRINITY_DN14667_c0_g1_i1.p1 TRINITY_DN14667_c0_g1~~TRINITY_DN14667_c0_g1_i1.p1  ORF type:complete len:519 (+),score=154.61 TRINITY_DN14667_c0_g1_i1:80-1558(+)
MTAQVTPVPPLAAPSSPAGQAGHCCATSAVLGWALSCVLAGVLYFVLWILLEDVALPGKGPVFPIWAIFVACSIAGFLVSSVRISGTAPPDLLGMMLVGFLLRNVGALDGFRDSWSAAIRQLALAVILMRAGLGLDLAKLRALGRPTVLLSFVPCTLEATTVALVSRWILSPQPPWVWTWMLGFVVAAVSPAVVVPSLKHLQDEGYGVVKGIPDMVLCAAGLDDVVAITGYGVFLGIAFNDGGLVLALLHGPIDLGVGLVGGYVAGWLLGQLRHAPGLPASRDAGALLAAGVSAVLGFGKLGHSGGGCLLAMTAAFVTKRHWPAERIKAADGILKSIWDQFAKALLFGCIGAAVELSFLDGSLVGSAIGVIACGMAVRLPVSYLVTHGNKLTVWERAFVTLSWLPKATVQAALGPIALDKAQEKNPVDPDEERWGEQVLCISALAILLTAPLGAVLIAITGTKWLERDPKHATPGSPTSGQVPSLEMDERLF